MSGGKEVSEVDVALESMAADVGQLAREKAVGAAKLASAQQRIRQLQAELEERDATIAALTQAAEAGVVEGEPIDPPGSQPEQET